MKRPNQPEQPATTTHTSRPRRPPIAPAMRSVAADLAACPTMPRARRRTAAPTRWMPQLLAGALACSLAACAAGSLDPGAGAGAERRNPEPPSITVAWQPVEHSADANWFRSVLTLENHGPGALDTS